MTLQRWKLGNYIVEYLPSEDSRNLKPTEDITSTANGSLSNPNLFFDDNIQFAINLYDKPTYFGAPITPLNIPYKSMDEKTSNGKLYLLRNNINVVDTTNKDGIDLNEIQKNLNEDPLFKRGCAVQVGRGSDTIYTLISNVATYNGATATSSISGGVLSVSGTTSSGNAGDIRPTFASVFLNKTLGYTIQYRTKYISPKGSLFMTGSLSSDYGNTERILSGFKTKQFTQGDGWEYWEYYIPPNAFTGSGNLGRLSLFHNWATNATVNLQLKDFQIEIGSVASPTIYYRNNSQTLLLETVAGGSLANAVCRTDTKIVMVYANGDFVQFDENGTQISKYNINDTDYMNASSMVWDGSNSIYVLCRYGKVFKTSLVNGANQMVYQANDFTANKNASLSAYKEIHLYNGMLGMVINNTLAYFDNLFNRIYATDIPSSSLGGLIGLSYGSTANNFYAITNTNFMKMLPNTCGVDIQTIKNLMSNGLVMITDEKGVSMPTIVSSIGIKRLRNKQDARYQLSFSGKIL